MFPAAKWKSSHVRDNLGTVVAHRYFLLLLFSESFSPFCSPFPGATEYRINSAVRYNSQTLVFMRIKATRLSFHLVAWLLDVVRVLN
jgi:hypothetical protein